MRLQTLAEKLDSFLTLEYCLVLSCYSLYRKYLLPDKFFLLSNTSSYLLLTFQNKIRSIIHGPKYPRKCVNGNKK